MEGKRYLGDLINQKIFRFDRLSIADIDNEPVAKLFSSTILREEVCLFANTVADGNGYIKILHNKIVDSLQRHKPLPVVRFADGEYAFYRYTLKCNGLYQQAESINAIKNVMPQHIDALRYLSSNGFLSPLIFPGNSSISSKSIFSFLRENQDSSGADFLDFLNSNGITLNADNYIPFYIIYAYLTSSEFAEAVHGKNICILNSTYDEKSCYSWFARYSSHPLIHYIPIPAEYVATRWEENKKEILNKIPSDTVLCITGAGVGALLICADVARDFSIPVIDAGHVVNMMNGRVDKSNGARLYTIRKAK